MKTTSTGKAQPRTSTSLLTPSAAVLALGALLSFAPCLAHADVSGPQSVYYLTAGSPGRLLGVQGASILFDNAQSPTGQLQWAVAVNSTVRTLGFGRIGGEYTLAGVPTGTTYAFPSGPSQELYDGTTDGTWNYAWDYGTGRVYQFSLAWTSPTVLFTLGNVETHRLGITYDATNNSIWLSGWDGTYGARIENYNLGGVLISSFTVAHDHNVALALDPEDGTLWLRNLITGGTSLTLEQYTKTGTLLDTVVFTGVEKDYPVFGGEFQLVPEPSSALLLAGSGVAMLLRRRAAAR